MAESDDAQMQRTSLLGLVRTHVTLVLTLIPILLSGLRIFAVANGDRPTLVTRLSTLDVTAVLLGTFAGSSIFSGVFPFMLLISAVG